MSPRSAPPTQTYTHVHAHAQARAHTHMHTRQKYLVALGVDWRRPLRAMEFRECTCGASACEATRTTKRFLCIHVYLSVSVCVSVRLYPYISIHSSIHTFIYAHTYLSIYRLLVDAQEEKREKICPPTRLPHTGRHLRIKVRVEEVLLVHVISRHFLCGGH